jgi:hypothetical protein
MMINNFLVWFDVLKGIRPKRHFWQAINNFSGNDCSSPWAQTYQRYIEDTFLYYGECNISYPDWVTTKYWTAPDLENI